MKRNTYQVAVFNGKEYQLDYLASSYLRLHLRAVQSTTLTISQAVEHRPDLVAVEAYGLPDAWWVLCLANGIINPQRELVAGRVLKVPNLSDVEQVLHNAMASSRQASRIGNKMRV